MQREQAAHVLAEEGIGLGQHLVREYDQATLRVIPIPTHLSIPKAAKLTGFSVETVREWVNRAVDPLPYILEGNGRKKISTEALLDYLRKMEIGGMR